MDTSPLKVHEAISSPDFVVVFRASPKEVALDAACDQLEKLIQNLAQVGLEIQCRYGGKGVIFVFLRYPDTRLQPLIWSSRTMEVFHGLRSTATVVANHVLPSMTESPTTAERLRAVYKLIISPARDGGAGITPQSKEWPLVESVFPLRDSKFNMEWLKKWSKEWWVGDSDFRVLCRHHGEKIALYFAFTQFYMLFLLPLALLGIFAHFCLPEYHPFYAVMLSFWTVLFKHIWDRRQRDLAIQWGVKGVTKLPEQRRAAFVSEGERIDPISGETVGWFPRWKSMLRRLMFIPVGVLFGLLLMFLLTIIFAFEIYLSEIYDGPLRQYLSFAPTILLTFIFPLLSKEYAKVAYAWTEYENHRTDQGFENAMTQKVFVSTFLTGYMSLFLTAYVYVPFGHYVIPRLEIFSSFLLHFLQGTNFFSESSRRYTIEPTRVREQLIYFGVAGQILQNCEEYFIPYISRKFFSEAKRITHMRDDTLLAKTKEEELVYLEKVRSDMDLPEYEIYEDYAEMAIQFGYVSLWSIVWPLLPLACVVNNWIEVRSDAAKICTSQRRPVPHRADSIGPWLDNIAFLSWLGSLTTWTLVYFFRGDHVTDLNQTMMLYLLITILVVERSYWIVDRFIGKWSQKIRTAGELNLMKEEYRLRRTMSIDLDTQKHEQVDLTGTSIVQSPLLEQMHVTDLELRRIVDDAKDLLTSGLKAEK